MEIQGLAYDSRSIRPGRLFVALRGHAQDGHRFLSHAVQNGATALVAEDFSGFGEDVCRVRVANSRAALSRLAVNWHRRPFEGITLVGITGTNGKTTTSYILEAILKASGAEPGIIGTIDCHFAGRKTKASVTTPESLDLMGILREMADSGVTDVAMEVSSHALDQERTRDCPFRVAVFTNLSRDHLDYHGSMEAYFEAKSRLFRRLREKGGRDAAAVVNLDDPWGAKLADCTDARVVGYGLTPRCDVRAEDVRIGREGTLARLIAPEGEIGIRSGLMGEFNIYNILAASAAALSLGIDLETVGKGIEGMAGVPGRLERVENDRSLSIVVDYAHTPDALLKVLRAVRPSVQGRLITVFGCGGDRDKGKRREMGRVAGENSDLVFVTSDNPRTEDPAAIASQVEEGVLEAGMERLSCNPAVPEGVSGYILEIDRAGAIRMAVKTAGENDLIVIAGKGHEDYQIIGRERRDFDDRIAAALAARRER